MPAATRAAKRGLGSTAGMGWTGTSPSCVGAGDIDPYSGSGARKISPSAVRGASAAPLELRDLALEPLEALLDAVRWPPAMAAATGAGGLPRLTLWKFARRRADACSAPRAAPAGARDAPPAGARSAARASRPAPPCRRTRCSRSVRVFSSPGVCAPRSMSTSSTAISASSRPSAPSSVWRYFIERRLDQLASVAHLRCTSRSMRAADRVLVVVHHRVAVGGLVAGQPQRVERERIDVGRGPLLLDQAADHADLDGIRFHLRLRGFTQVAASTRLHPAHARASRRSWSRPSWGAFRSASAGSRSCSTCRR